MPLNDGMTINQFIQQIRKNESFIRYFSNTSWLMLERLSKMTLGFFMVLYVARYLGPALYGDFNYVQNFAFLFAPIAILGLDAVVVKYLVISPEKRNVLLGTSFMLKLGGAVLSILLVLVGVLFTNNDASMNSLIYLVSMVTIFQSFNVIDFYYQAQVKSKYVVITQIITLCVSALLKFLFVYLQLPLLYFVWIVLIESVVQALGLLVFYIHHHSSIVLWRFDKAIAKQLLSDSWPLMLSGLAVSLYIRTDQVMIKEMMDSASVGYYAAAVKVSEVWNFVPVLLVASIFPGIIKTKKVSEKLYYFRLQSLFDGLVWVLVPVIVIVSLFSSQIIALLYGAQYEASSTILSIHVWASIFSALGVSSSKWFVIEGYYKLTFYRTLLGAVINIGLNYLFIPIYGIVGAAYATLFSYATAAFFSDAIGKKTRPIFYMKLQTLNVVRIYRTIKNYKVIIQELKQG